MGQSEKLNPPIFEEAVKTITDPNYGLGLIWLWQLSNTHPFHKAAAIHDLRYDYLEPGEVTTKVDRELESNFNLVCSTNPSELLWLEKILFVHLAESRGGFFTNGKVKCEQRQYHNFEPCTYGQNIVYDLRCTTCGLHKSAGALTGTKVRRA